jgi:hypothetical protein
VITTRKIDEVKKALECCIVRNPDEHRNCPDCPYRDPQAYCVNRLMVDALEAIVTLVEGVDTLSAAIDALTGGECEECKVEPEEKA